MKKKVVNNDLSKNKAAFFKYEIIEKFEAGIKLTGTEVKSSKLGQINIKEGFITIRNGEAWLNNVNISPYSFGSLFNADPLRTRKLLLHKKQIESLGESSQKKGLTIVPLAAYIKNGFIKISIGLARGKNLVDKRNTIKERDQKREIQRVLKNKF